MSFKLHLSTDGDGMGKSSGTDPQQNTCAWTILRMICMADTYFYQTTKPHNTNLSASHAHCLHQLFNLSFMHNKTRISRLLKRQWIHHKLNVEISLIRCYRFNIFTFFEDIVNVLCYLLLTYQCTHFCIAKKESQYPLISHIPNVQAHSVWMTLMCLVYIIRDLFAPRQQFVMRITCASCQMYWQAHRRDVAR